MEKQDYRMKLGTILLFLLCCFGGNAQQKRTFTLREVIDLAQKQSPSAISARHSFQASYWEYRSYRANLLPSLTLTSSPNLIRNENQITLENGKKKFVMQEQMNVDATLTLNQNIPWTGGQLFIRSRIQRADELSDHSFSYNTEPIIIGYSQNLFGYKALKWNMKTQPLYFEQAKKNYVENMELVASQACSKFFQLAGAQSDLVTARINSANADTLYQFAKGRYNIGTITENDLLQLEINKLQSEKEVIEAESNVNYYQQRLRSYLGLNDGAELELFIEDSVPSLNVDVEQAMALTMQNSPDVLELRIKKLESESNVAYAKANRGLKADVYAQFGLTKTSDDIKTAYDNTIQQQYVSLGITVPILDWGNGKGKVKVAKSRLELTNAQINQTQNDIEENVLQTVWQFNLQGSVIRIASKAANIAQKHHDVTQRLYLLGKSTILDLNAAISGKDSKKRAFINALSSYWGLYYALRSITLYDFERQEPLTENWVFLFNK